MKSKQPKAEQAPLPITDPKELKKRALELTALRNSNPDILKSESALFDRSEWMGWVRSASSEDLRTNRIVGVDDVKRLQGVPDGTVLMHVETGNIIRLPHKVHCSCDREYFCSCSRKAHPIKFCKECR